MALLLFHCTHLGPPHLWPYFCSFVHLWAPLLLYKLQISLLVQLFHCPIVQSFNCCSYIKTYLLTRVNTALLEHITPTVSNRRRVCQSSIRSHSKKGSTGWTSNCTVFMMKFSAKNNALSVLTSPPAMASRLFFDLVKCLLIQMCLVYTHNDFFATLHHFLRISLEEKQSTYNES